MSNKFLDEWDNFLNKLLNLEENQCPGTDIKATVNIGIRSLHFYAYFHIKSHGKSCKITTKSTVPKKNGDHHNTNQMMITIVNNIVRVLKVPLEDIPLYMAEKDLCAKKVITWRLEEGI